MLDEELLAPELLEREELLEDLAAGAGLELRARDGALAAGAERVLLRVDGAELTRGALLERLRARLVLAPE